MTGWIQNVSAGAAQDGNHFDCGSNAMLIQISDPVTDKVFTAPWFPQPRHQFKEVHQFRFLDIEDGDTHTEEFGVTDSQAAELVRLLQHAIDEDMNVIVHCAVGICRSGAVCEVGVMMGMGDTNTHRQPNLRVKTKMMKQLGYSYY